MANPKNILLIEENHSDRTTLSDMLENWGCHVTTLHSNSEALSKLVSEKYSFVIVSFESSGMPCSEFVANVKTQYPDVEVLVIGNSIAVDDAVSVMKNGALDYIVKPVAAEKLALFSENVFNGSQVKQVSKKKEALPIITVNNQMKRLFTLVDKIADSTASVLVQGESGTGKELLAKYLHEKSGRNNGPFIAVNCAALPENLLESELFGHEKGAFTGAITRKAGKFELANNGTILLDEITEMQFHLQAKLLRVIQEREVDRLGGLSPVKVNVRVVATTNRNMEEIIANGEFREDLYYRLNVIPVVIPPLRNRWEDIIPLAEFFIEKFNRIDGRNVKCLTKEAADLLSGLKFKGNVRELENIIQRAVILSDDESITVENLFLDDKVIQNSEKRSTHQNIPDDILASPLKDVERKMIYHTLDKTGGNRTHAAKILEISVRTLRNKLNEYKEKNITIENPAQ